MRALQQALFTKGDFDDADVEFTSEVCGLLVVCALCGAFYF